MSERDRTIGGDCGAEERKQILQLGEDALRKALEWALDEVGLDRLEAQRVIEAGGVLAEDIKLALATKLVKLGRARYANEEEKPGLAYFHGSSVEPLSKQIAILCKVFGLDGQYALAYAEKLPELPPLAEGWFAVPRWQAVAENYGQALAKLLELFGRSELIDCYWKLETWMSDDTFDEKHLCPHVHTAQYFRQIEQAQSGNILVVPAQLGLRHRGRSVRHSRELFSSIEFGLGSFHSGSILLTHPHRMFRGNLGLDCPGDEYSPRADGQFYKTPTFYMTSDLDLQFNSHRNDRVGSRFGSASGFLPSDLC